MKTIIFFTIVTILGIFSVSRVALAKNSSLIFSPASLTSAVGKTLDVSIQVFPANTRVCTVKGTVNFKNLTCQSMTVTGGLVAQTTPNCANPGFVISIPNCETTAQSILSVAVAGAAVGQASLSFTGVNIVGASADIPFSTQIGAYDVVAAQPTTPAARPANLFDIVLNVENAVIKKSSDLVCRTQFINFGTEPTLVKLVYRVVDAGGREVFTDTGSVTVDTDRFVTKEFKKLNIGRGNYSLILATTYGDNVQDEFKQAFEVQGATTSSTGMAWWVWIVVALAVVGIGGLIIFLLMKRTKITANPI